MAYRLKAHQTDALLAMDANANYGLLICLEMGLGKSAVALTWLIRRFRERRIEDALVVCPASLVPNWEAAIEKMAMFEGVGPQDVQNLRDRVRVVSFQKTYRVVKTPVMHRDGTVTEKRTLHLREAVDKRWGAVIVDEVHCIGAHDSLQSKAVRTLARLTSYRFGLTGTPVSGGGGTKGFGKLFGELEFVHPGIFGTWSRFCSEYVVRFNRFYQPEEYDVAKCTALLEDHAIVARVEDCIDLPGTTDTDMVCPIQARAKRVYDDFRKGITEEHGVTIKAAGGQYPRMLQLCSGSLKKDDGSTELFDCSKDAMLAEILNGTDDAVVVFCKYRASVDRCEKVARKAGRHPLVFDGRSKGPVWQDFQKGKGDVLVCQYQSGGTGLDLFRSHTMVLFEPTFSALDLQQCLARTYRTGQTSHCLYYYLSTPKTVEERAWATVRSGKDITDRTMSEWAMKGLDL